MPARAVSLAVAYRTVVVNALGAESSTVKIAGDVPATPLVRTGSVIVSDGADTRLTIVPVPAE